MTSWVYIIRHQIRSSLIPNLHQRPNNGYPLAQYAAMILFIVKRVTLHLLRAAKEEFEEANLQIKVLDQWGKAWLPGSVPSLAHCGFLFHQWMSHFTESRLFIAYDYSHDMQLLEDAIAACGLSWPKQWEPCYLGILNDDPAGDTAKEVMWHTMARHFHLERHVRFGGCLCLTSSLPSSNRRVIARAY